jgi:glutaminyl-peptide cyclotransferase
VNRGRLASERRRRGQIVVGHEERMMKRPDGQTVFLGSAVAIALVTVLVLVLGLVGEDRTAKSASPQSAPLDPSQVPVNGERSYGYLQDLCRMGARFSGSPGMQQQQEYLEGHFRQQGGEVQWQRFRVRHPVDGSPVAMANLIVHWHPERQQRILLCAHYDTRPFPDRDLDPRGRRGLFVGANDGASGVAVLMELGHLMTQLESDLGVDFVLFDGEELVYDDDRDPYFLGSRYFAQKYVQQPPEHRYRAAVLLDMVGDKHLELFQERHSIRWGDSRPLVEQIWRVAKDLGVSEFIPRRGHAVRDDHLMLHDVAGIPACDIIDFDYGPPGTSISYWHTREDTPDKCSAESLGKVGYVIWEWLRRLK